MRICPTASSEFFGLAAPEFPGAAIVMPRFRAEKSPPGGKPGKGEGEEEGRGEELRERRRERGREERREKGKTGGGFGGEKEARFCPGAKKLRPDKFLLDKRVKKVI